MIIIHDLVKEDVSIDTCAARCNVYIIVPEPLGEVYTPSPQACCKIEQHLVAGSRKQVKRTKSPCLALDIGVKFGEC